MNNAHQGYSNIYEWKKADPESYDKWLDGFSEKMKFKLDEDFASKIANIKIDPNDKFADAIDRACKGELTPVEIAICGDPRPDIIPPPLPPEKWYVKLWDWVKGFFVKPKNMDDFKKYEPGESEPTPPLRVVSGPNVELNEEFDFREWLLERNDRIIKAIKEDGKEENTITCPVCYDKRQYYIATNGHIHSNCEKCGIRITQ